MTKVCAKIKLSMKLTWTNHAEVFQLQPRGEVKQVSCGIWEASSHTGSEASVLYGWKEVQRLIECLCPLTRMTKLQALLNEFWDACHLSLRL